MTTPHPSRRLARMSPGALVGALLALLALLTSGLFALTMGGADAAPPQTTASVLRPVTARELDAPRYEVAEALEKAALAELRERRPDRVLETNVEFWAAIVLDFAQVPAHMFTSMFTCARLAGWSAHILEQKKTGRLIRPSARYVGPAPRKPEQVPGWDAKMVAPTGYTP